MSKSFGIVSLLISVTALALAASVYWRADEIADAAVARRERAMAEKLKPKVSQIMSDFEVKADLHNVTTLDALFAPLLRLTTDVN